MLLLRYEFNLQGGKMCMVNTDFSTRYSCPVNGTVRLGKT